MGILTPFKGLTHRIWLLAIVNFINRSGGMLMCFLSLYITESLNYSILYAGYAMSIYGVGAILGQQLGGYFTDKIGYQRVQLISLIATGGMMLWLMEVRNFYLLCFVLFFLNAASEAFRPANTVAISFNSDDSNRTRSFSLMRIAFNLAITFALTVGGWLITKSWSYIFVADAMTCFASALALFLFVPEVHRKAKPDKSAPPPEAVVKISPYSDMVYMRFILGTFLGALVFMQIMWTIPPFFKQVYHWDEFTIGLVSAVNGAVVMLVEMPLVHRIEKKRPALWIVRLGVVVYGLSYLILTLPTAFMWIAAIGFMVIISFGEIFVMPFSTTWATKRSPKAQEGQYMSVYGIAYAAANILAPLMGTQIIYYFGFRALWGIIAAIAFIAYFVFNGIYRQSIQDQ
ncbi:MAG: MFS transporter [Sphingobacteriales bacterium]|nr:MAG: MFS transporter [Sphingobacteriales bacterium]